MGKQDAAAAELQKSAAQLDKIGTEITALKDEITALKDAAANADNVSPDLQAAIDAVVARTQTLDDLNPDTAPPPPPATDTDAATNPA